MQPERRACPACGETGPHEVEYTYYTPIALVFPLFVTGQHYGTTCNRCGHQEGAPKPPGLKAPWMHRFGGLVVVALLALGWGGWQGYLIYEQQSWLRHDEEERDNLSDEIAERIATAEYRAPVDTRDDTDLDRRNAASVATKFGEGLPFGLDVRFDVFDARQTPSFLLASIPPTANARVLLLQVVDTDSSLILPTDGQTPTAVPNHATDLSHEDLLSMREQIELSAHYSFAVISTGAAEPRVCLVRNEDSLQEVPSTEFASIVAEAVLANVQWPS